MEITPACFLCQQHPQKEQKMVKYLIFIALFLGICYGMFRHLDETFSKPLKAKPVKTMTPRRFDPSVIA